MLTDFDPKGEDVSQEDADPDGTGVLTSYGKNRVVNQIMIRILDEDMFDTLTFDQILKKASDYGVFMNEFTFEIDLFNAGAEDEFEETAKGLTENKKMHERFSALASDPTTLD